MKMKINLNDTFEKLQRIKSYKSDIINAVSDTLGLDLNNRIGDWVKQVYDYNNIEVPKVNFYDYDGTLLHSIPIFDLMEMPQLPSHPGLICQEWNWSLEDIKEYTNKYGSLNVGATYTTDDGKTRLYIDLGDNNITVPLYFNQSASKGVKINWGDGSSEETIDGTEYVNTSHTYASKGSYVITLEVEDGELVLGQSGTYNIFNSNTSYISNILKRLEIGENVTSIGNYAFKKCYHLRHIIIPNSIINMGYSIFSECNCLQSITIPNGITSIKDNTFDFCHNLQLVYLPNTITSINWYAFRKCHNLQLVYLPNTVTSIGYDVFSCCYSLQSITIPDSVTSIGENAFSYCDSLESITIPEGVKNINKYTFYDCSSLQMITLPSTVIKINQYAFSNCSSLQMINIPEGVTSIGNNAFQGCKCLQSVIIPNTVTSIGSSAFSGCISIRQYDFRNCSQVPSLSNINSFNNMTLGCKILVPASLYNDWINTTNWTTYADNIVAVP